MYLLKFIELNVINLIYTIFAIFSIWLYYNLIYISPRKRRMINKIKGPFAWPIFGNALEFVGMQKEDIPKFAEKFLNKYGHLYRVWLFNKPYIAIGKAEYVEKILSSTIHTDKGTDYDMIKPWLQTGLLTSNGKKWQTRRRLIGPSFHFQILEDYLKIFNESSKVLVKLLEKESERGDFFKVEELISHCSLDIICETAMGKKLNSQINPNSDYVKAIYGISDLFVSRLMKPWLRLDPIWKLTSGRREEKKYLKTLHGFTEKVIRERKFELANSSKKEKRRLAFLDLLLEVSQDGKYLSDLDIREETDTFMFEGHDTTSVNMVWVLFTLGQIGTHFQDKVREEVNQIFNAKINGENLTMEDVGKLKYLECCIKETLRLYPSVHSILRQIKSDLDIGDGIILPSNTSIAISPMMVQRDPDYYENPTVFNPERWLEEGKNTNLKKSPFSFIPFSAGPRNCIGQKFAMIEEKVILAYILRNFRFETRNLPSENIAIPDILLRPSDKLKFKMYKI